MDEYELSFRERSSTEDAFAAIEHVLLERELRLNPRKTKMGDLPFEFEPEWIEELRGFQFRTSAVGQANDLIKYFDYVTRYLEKNPTEHIAKYAIARIRTLAISQSNHKLFQSLLCHCMAFEPGAARECIQAIHFAETNHGLVVDTAQLEATVNVIIEQNAPVAHDYEVSWCLWAALNWSLNLLASVATKLSNVENSIVAILALDADQRGLFLGQLDKSLWQARMTAAELYEDEWLLAYEANVQGWLPTLGGGDHVAADPGFAFLKQQGVRFYTPVNNPFVPGALAYP